VEGARTALKKEEEGVKKVCTCGGGCGGVGC
jgi:hypothetical protein